jgi:hypothetical protein
VHQRHSRHSFEPTALLFRTAAGLLPALLATLLSSMLALVLRTRVHALPGFLAVLVTLARFAAFSARAALVTLFLSVHWFLRSRCDSLVMTTLAAASCSPRRRYRAATTLADTMSPGVLTQGSAAWKCNRAPPGTMG